jgi:hypothetical protein
MSLSSQQHADLADDAYKNYAPGVRNPGQKDEMSINGVMYNILEHYRNPRTGYAGTVYQRTDTGEIEVAHRGTEVKNIPGLVMDLAFTDGSMVLRKVNPQADDAIALTQRAVQYAKEEGLRNGGHTPQVTVTGHSLGGTLAEITAHHFDLRGETFNAYGAASLGMGIPEGGGKVINHVMAADLVSAAAPHYGQVKVYAEQKEMDMLGRFGYDNDRQDLGDLRAKGVAPFATIGSHFMSHFVDGDSPRERSMLSDPDARARAHQFDPLIDKFREDVREQRGAFTAMGQAASYVSGNLERGEREPLAPGDPALRAGHMKEQVVTPPLPEHLREGPAGPARGSHAMPSGESAPTQERPDGERVVIPPLPDHLREHVREPGSPQANSQPLQPSPQHMIDRLSPRERDNYDQGLSLAQRLGLPPDKAQNFGMAMAAQINDYGLIQRTDRMVAVQGRGENGGDRVYASFHPHGDKEPIFNTSLDVNRAANMPVEDSFRRIAQTQQQQIALAQTQGMDEPARAARMG